LLHDIGKIVLSSSLNGAYAKLIQEVEARQISLVDAEKKLLGTNHAEVGSELLSQWKFPPNVVAAIWFHHAPAAAGTHQRLASYVYMGNVIAHFMGLGYGHAGFALRARTEALTTLGLTPESVPQFMIETFEQLHVIEALFAIVP
ncbi:MAG: metal dependent phosphohydrolase, partial [Pedosphaera sp.]|nr:metal dependent phosphohydrolase [Pedosphaera sp.]